MLKNNWGHLIGRFILGITSISLISLLMWGLMREKEVVELYEMKKD